MYVICITFSKFFVFFFSLGKGGQAAMVQQTENRKATDKEQSLKEELGKAKSQLSTAKKTIQRLRVRISKLRTASKNLLLKYHSNKKGISKQSLLTHLKKYLDGKAYQFVATQIKLASRHGHGLRYTIQDKSFAMSMYSSSPKLYRLLRKVFKLPAPRTLQRILFRLGFKPGFCTSILESLKKKAESMGDNEKVCVLLSDEMSLKEAVHYDEHKDQIIGFEDLGDMKDPHIANHALTFMVKGLAAKWKQPFAYFFTSGPMKADKMRSLTVKAIRWLRSCGLRCLVLVCDQGSNNRSMLRQLGVTIDKPYFIVDDIKVFVIYDPPHAIKNIRNNMKSAGFVLDNKKISWSIIEELYRYDSKRDIRLVKKLTKSHVYLNGFGLNMRVKLATQVLSHSVAAAIETLVAIKGWEGEQKEVALATAKFCDDMDKLFNVFNSKTKNSSRPYAGAITKDSNHFQFLDECLQWLPRLHTPGNEGKTQLPCVQAWQLNINSLKLIWNEVSSEKPEKHGVNQLITNRLNQDSLENFHCLLRSKNRCDERPDSVRFETAFKSLACESVFKLSELANCEDGSYIS